MAKAYRGVLKARISKLYGGDVTIEKARKLKARPSATARDKQLANWFINMQTNRPLKKRKDPVVGTGKKPKGSDRRLYTDEDPTDTVPIKFATVADARKTIAKVMKINKPYARKVQILTVLEQRAKVMGKMEQARLAKSAKATLNSKNEKSSPVKKATRKVCLPKAKIASMSSSEKQKVINAKKAAASKGKRVRSSKSFIRDGSTKSKGLRDWVKQDWRQVGNPSKKCGEK